MQWLPVLKRKRFLVLLAVLPLMLLAVPSTGAATPTPSANSVSATPDPELSAYNLLGSEVNEVAINDFPTVFTGSIGSYLTDTITVYETSSDTELNSQIAMLDAGTGVTIIYSQTSQSYQALEQLTHELAIAGPTLKGEGIDLGEWGPNPATGEVSITLLTPTAAALEDLSSYVTSLNGVTTVVSASEYVAIAAPILVEEYGASNITVNPSTMVSPTFDSYTRYGDSSPFYGGDTITNSSDDTCSSGFEVTGNASGNEFQLTAGHCDDGGSSTWYNNSDGDSDEYGATSTNYFQDAADDDFQTLYGEEYAPYVWTSDGSLSSDLGVKAVGYPAEGDYVAVDGSITGLVTDNEVLGTGECVTFNDQYEDCWLSEVQGDSVLCQPGDSGGPVITRLSGGGADADGLIVGETDSGYDCYFFDLPEALQASNTSLATS